MSHTPGPWKVVVEGGCMKLAGPKDGFSIISG